LALIILEEFGLEVTPELVGFGKEVELLLCGVKVSSCRLIEQTPYTRTVTNSVIDSLFQVCTTRQSFCAFGEEVVRVLDV
jgi:hypothetical protein